MGKRMNDDSYRKIIADYFNGNVHIQLYDDGTRIMETDDNDFEFDMPTNIDLTITHSCNGHCPYCYLNCTDDGAVADLNHPALNTLGKYQELAINLNDMEIPNLLSFLKKMKTNSIFVNGTISQTHFMAHYKELLKLCDEQLLWGIGVSLTKASAEFVRIVKKFPNIVIHVINGIVSQEDIEILSNKGLKLLVLGYKNIGRGEDYSKSHMVDIYTKQKYLKGILPKLFSCFNVISFDNLSIEQLNVKQMLTQKQWDEFYQGDEGTSTFYIDLVSGKYGVSSLCKPEEMLPMTDSIEEMFAVIKQKAREMRAI